VNGPDLYVAIKYGSLAMVLALAAGHQRFVQTKAIRTSAPTAPTIPVSDQTNGGR
jgi:hypothetical protein